MKTLSKSKGVKEKIKSEFTEWEMSFVGNFNLFIGEYEATVKKIEDLIEEEKQESFKSGFKHGLKESRMPETLLDDDIADWEHDNLVDNN